MKLTQAQRDFLEDPANIMDLTNILSFHVTELYNPTVMRGAVELETALTGRTLAVSSSGESGDLPVVQGDIPVVEKLLFAKGNVMVVDTVLIPTTR